MYSTITNSATYTVVDIRKAFEGCEADIRMIARRTGKWSMADVDKVFHDILKLAEEGYLHSVAILLSDSSNKVIKATKFAVNASGTAITSDRAGANDWTDISNTHLSALLTYTKNWLSLTSEQKTKFRADNSFCIAWEPSSIDNNFPHLVQSKGQLYASKGFEVQKITYK